jgi:thioesterase domain-containing protein
MEQRLRSLQEFLLKEIPIAKHLGVSVAAYENGCLALNAPFQANSNQHSTGFAGSLNAVTTLAGWGQLWLILKEYGYDAQIVIQNSVVEYLRPVTTDFTAVCHRPERTLIERLIKVLARKGKARLTLSAEISEAGERAVSFTGRYVATLIELSRFENDL